MREHVSEKSSHSAILMMTMYESIACKGFATVNQQYVSSFDKWQRV